MNQRPFFPATERNKDPIFKVLQGVLAGDAEVLEIGSGSGQHAQHFCRNLAGISWQPSEIEAAVATLALGLNPAPPNILPPVVIDVEEPRWPAGLYDAIYSANTLHIMSWQHVVAFFCGIARHLKPGGKTVLYGPFKYYGQHTAESNAAFDLELRHKAPQMGIRDLAELLPLARMTGLALVDDVEMPVNNRVLIFARLGNFENE